jgi:hypothetical protein
MRAATAIAASPAWGLAAEASIVAAVDSAEVAEAHGAAAVAHGGVAVAVAGKHNSRSILMQAVFTRSKCSALVTILCGFAWACISAALLSSAQQPAAKTLRPPTPSPGGAKLFNSPQQAADALVDAAAKFDVTALTEIFGPDGDDVVFTGEFAQDRERATDFAAEAREKKVVSVDPKTGTRAFLIVGIEDWPFPVPIVKTGQKWYFDSKAGERELLYRRIGANELDAIGICRGYVDAQHEYALQKHAPGDVNEYAQHIVSTAGKQDGLAWRNPDDTWGGPIGENIARAIEQGYTSAAEPYHGYFFKILKGQGPAVPPGEMDFVVKGKMIGGFALVAAPAEYEVTGVRTFIVSHDGVVYEKDLGPKTLDEFKKMERFNPDKSWTPVESQDE